MKAFLCSVGQPTTEICKEQLEKFGFDVVLLDFVESWEDKYKRFIKTAKEDCIRVDADVIPNENISYLKLLKGSIYKMGQAKGYDFYKNNVGVIGITFYSQEALVIIENNLDKLNWKRPEATAWRLIEINDWTFTLETVCGLHGFFQSKEDLERHLKHKIERKQISDYDFELAEQLLHL